MNRDSLVASGFVAAWRAVRLMPEDAAHATFRRIADGIYRRNGPGVQQLRANLAAATDQDVTREAVRSYLRYWCEAFRLPSWPIDDLVARTRTVGEDHLRKAYGDNGAIVALPHTANWDWAGAWATATGMPVLAVAERLKPERVYDEFVAYRRSIGMEIVALGEPGLVARLGEGLARGRLVCLLSDRDLTSTGVEVELLGRRARVPRGAAVLSQRTGASIIPGTFSYAGRESELRFHPPVPIQTGRTGSTAMMQAVADAFTEGIRAHPQNWHMMQKVFVQ